MTGHPRTWTITRDQLIDAIANIRVQGVRVPGRDDPIVVADEMADAILSQFSPPLPVVTELDDPYGGG